MVPRTALPLVALLLLVVSAGCLTTPSPGTATETATQTPTPSPAPPAPPATETPETLSPSETTAYGTDCPPHLSVEPTTKQEAQQADRLVAFENLSPDRRRAFERALNGGTTLESDDVDPWVGTAVEYEGNYYRTTVAVC